MPEKFDLYFKNFVICTSFFENTLIRDIMSRICDLTGKKAMVGNKVSHSNRKTTRRFNPNLVTKKFFIPETGEWITLKVSTSALKTINKKGITACLKEAWQKGYIK